MAHSKVSVTEGSGKNLNTWDRTVSSVLVQDQVVIPGEFPLASYFATTYVSASVATANDHPLQIMAGSSNKVRIRRIRIEQAANATTAALCVFNITRVSTAGTGGTAVTPRKFDPADSAASATAMILPTSKGTEGDMLIRTVLLMRQAVSATSATVDDAWEWTQHPGTPPIIIAAGTSNGIVIKNESAIAGASVTITIEFTESSF